MAATRFKSGVDIMPNNINRIGNVTIELISICMEILPTTVDEDDSLRIARQIIRSHLTQEETL